MTKVYIHGKPLLVVSTNDRQQTAQYKGYQRIQHGDELHLAEALAALSAPETSGVLLQTENEDDVLRQLKDRFTVVPAGGGLVVEPAGRVLLIFRRGKWDLPKGKLDPGESMEACAIREVEEETGIPTVEIQSSLTTTYHTYWEKGQEMLKVSDWYRMEVPEAYPLLPQTEEDIKQALWVSPFDLPNYRSEMHASIVDVLIAGRFLK